MPQPLSVVQLGDAVPDQASSAARCCSLLRLQLVPNVPRHHHGAIGLVLVRVDEIRFRHLHGRKFLDDGVICVHLGSQRVDEAIHGSVVSARLRLL